jgi:hypothetical protein
MDNKLHVDRGDDIVDHGAASIVLGVWVGLVVLPREVAVMFPSNVSK